MWELQSRKSGKQMGRPGSRAGGGGDRRAWQHGREGGAVQGCNLLVEGMAGHRMSSDVERNGFVHIRSHAEKDCHPPDQLLIAGVYRMARTSLGCIDRARNVVCY